jgi:uncharacterized membrane protein
MSEEFSEPLQQQYDPADIEKNKVMAILAYIIFFIPLIAAPDSKFAKYHANQGLLLLLFCIAFSIVSSVIPIIGWFILGPICSILGLILFILGIINASQGKAKPLPVIGGITIIAP